MEESAAAGVIDAAEAAVALRRMAHIQPTWAKSFKDGLDGHEQGALDNGFSGHDEGPGFEAARAALVELKRGARQAPRALRWCLRVPCFRWLLSRISN